MRRRAAPGGRFHSVAAAAAAALVVAVAVTVALALLVHLREALLHDGRKGLHLVLVRGQELLHVAVFHDLHDVHFRLAVALVLAALARGRVHQHGVFLVLMVEIVDHFQLKLVSVVVGKHDDIALVLHGKNHLS